MEKNIVEYFDKILSSKGGHLPLNSLSGHLAELSQKERKYIKKIGGLEKLLAKYPDSFLMMDDEVYIIQKQAKKEKVLAEVNAKGDYTGGDKKSTVNLESAADDPCTVCSDPIEIYAVGECRHPICYRCCTKLRVLCEDKNCPVCRQTLNEVVFSKNLLAIDQLDLGSFIPDKKNGILFEDLSLCEQKSSLLRHYCPKCPGTHFETFPSLEAHVRDKHQLYYCEICVRQCKIFTDERKTYSKSELKKHIENGDVAGSATGGHPLCEFCQYRYLDNDELLRHLRLHHCSCRICDQANEEHKSYQFYADKNSLLEHQREKHFPCEHPDCIDLDHIPSFKDEIDLQSHVLQYHSGQKTKLEKRAEQRINVPFMYERKEARAVKRILKAEPDAVGGINITGCVSRRIERTYSFIERDDAPGMFVENVFFDLDACGLENGDDLKEQFKTGDRVTAYALPCTNPNAKSKWKAQKVERLDDEENGDDELDYQFETYHFDHGFDNGAVPLEGSLNEFPSLAPGHFGVLQQPLPIAPILPGWSKLAQTPAAKNFVLHTKKTKEPTPAAKFGYETGHIFHKLYEEFGFIVPDKNQGIYEENVYFHLKAFKSGLPTPVFDLRTVLSPGDKVWYTVQDSPAYPNVKSKYRAEVVLRYPPIEQHIPPQINDGVKISQAFPKNFQINKLPVITSDKEKALAEEFKKKIQSGVIPPLMGGVQDHSTVVVIEDLMVQPAVKKKYDLATPINGSPAWHPEVPNSSLTTANSIYSSQLAQVINTGTPNSGLSQDEMKLANSESSSSVYASSDEDESSDEENNDDVEVDADPNHKLFMDVIAVCLNKSMYKIFRAQLSVEMEKQGVRDQTYLQFVELRKEDSSAHILFRKERSTGEIGHTGYAKLEGFYPLDGSWTGELKRKEMATRITKELLKINGSSHYITVVRNKSEKLSRITIHYDRQSEAKN